MQWYIGGAQWSHPSCILMHHESLLWYWPLVHPKQWSASQICNSSDNPTKYSQKLRNQEILAAILNHEIVTLDSAETFWISPYSFVQYVMCCLAGTTLLHYVPSQASVHALHVHSLVPPTVLNMSFFGTLLLLSHMTFVLLSRYKSESDLHVIVPA